MYADFKCRDQCRILTAKRKGYIRSTTLAILSKDVSASPGNANRAPTVQVRTAGSEAAQVIGNVTDSEPDPFVWDLLTDAPQYALRFASFSRLPSTSFFS
jgi:hypothetical protein